MLTKFEGEVLSMNHSMQNCGPFTATDAGTKYCLCSLTCGTVQLVLVLVLMP